jgi:hypothetical protein
MRMGLIKEVLPPRQAPYGPCDLVSEAQIRAAITRVIWTSVALVGLANVIARLETLL